MDLKPQEPPKSTPEATKPPNEDAPIMNLPLLPSPRWLCEIPVTSTLRPLPSVHNLILIPATLGLSGLSPRPHNSAHEEMLWLWGVIFAHVPHGDRIPLPLFVSPQRTHPLCVASGPHPPPRHLFVSLPFFLGGFPCPPLLV